MNHLVKITNHWNDFPGDKTSLENLVRRELRPGIKVLEIGAWLGRTTILLSEVIREFGMLYVIDNWHGTDFWGDIRTQDESSKNLEYFHTYCSVIKEKGVYDKVRILNMSSQDASEIITDNFFDVIFLDDDHRYTSVKKDMITWYSKLKNNGLLIGHDCEVPFNRLDKTIQEQVLNPANQSVDFVKLPGVQINGHGGVHAGTIRAIHEIFDDKVETAAKMFLMG